MVVDMRKLGNGPGSARPVYQHGHFCVRTFHLLLAHPLYSCFLLFIIYLQLMDVILFYKIRARGPLDADIVSRNQTNSDLFHQKLSQTSNDAHIFRSLPVKKIMIGQTVNEFHYVEKNPQNSHSIHLSPSSI